MEIQLTTRAAAEYEFLRSGAMTPEMASQYLQDGRIMLRTFSETLRDQYPYPDLSLRLTTSLQAYEPESSPDLVRNRIPSSPLSLEVTKGMTIPTVRYAASAMRPSSQ